MTSGTLYYNPKYPRGNWLPAFAKFLGLDIDAKYNADSPEFAELFPLKKVPAFITSEGLIITEVMAIAYYFVDKANKVEEICGKTPEQRAVDIKWFSFFNTDIVDAIVAVWLEKDESKKLEKKAKADGYYQYIDDELKNSKYLGGDKPLLCDFYAYTSIHGYAQFGFKYDDFPNIVKYVDSLKTHEIFSS